MRFHLSGVALVAATFAIAPAAAAIDHEPFMIQTTQDLVDLCNSDPAGALYDDAVNFCHGYVAGVWQYHEAQANGPKGHRLVCPPTPTAMPKRAEAIAEFVVWANTHPQHAGDPAVETVFRFLIEKWPCPDAAAKKGASK